MDEMGRPPVDDLDALQEWLDRQRAALDTAPLNYVVSTKLRAAVRRRGLSQDDLAEALGERQPWVSKKLHAKVPMTVDELERFIVATGVSVLDLLPERLKNTPTDGYVRRLLRAVVGTNRRASVPRYMPGGRFALAA